MTETFENESIAGGPDPVERSATLAGHYNDVQRGEMAEKEAIRGLALDPRHRRLHIELIRSFLARGRWDDAEKAAERLLAIAPEFPQALNVMSLVRSHQGRFAEAETLVLEALRLAPMWAHLYESYGDLMVRTAHPDKARKLYERARSLDPEDADIPAKIALLEANRDRHDEAEAHARLGLALDPTESLAHASLGNNYLRRGRPFAARRQFREALRLDPSNASYEDAWASADLCCRVVYLPMYYWSLVLQRLPGKQFFLWGLFVGFTMLARTLKVPVAVVSTIALAYIGMCVYSWIATLLVKGWIKLVPPKMDVE